MAAFDFPSSGLVAGVTPANGYTWDGEKWTMTGGGSGSGGASITISDTPPASPTVGALWWESDTGNEYIYYNDGNSSQWVATNKGGAPLGPWTPFTPTVSSSVGTLTTTSAVGRYQQTGKTIVFSVTITLTAIGSGAGLLLMTLPVNGFAGQAQAVSVVEYGALGAGAQGNITAANNTRIQIVKYDGLTYIMNGAIFGVSGVYEAA